MQDDWFTRFREVLASDGRSKREISVAAGFGVNYVQQALKDEKEMGAGKLMSILRVLGSAQSLYVLTGIKMGPDDEEFFRIALSLPPELRSGALEFFRALQSRADTE